MCGSTADGLMAGQLAVWVASTVPSTVDRRAHFAVHHSSTRAALPSLPCLCVVQPPNVPVLEVQRMWLTNKQRNATDVTIVTQLSGAQRWVLAGAGCRMGWFPACWERLKSTAPHTAHAAVAVLHPHSCCFLSPCLSVAPH